MSNPRTFSKQIVRTLSRTVDNAVLLTLLVILIVGTYALWDTWQVYAAADVSTYQQYKPEADDTESFDELRAINPDVMGWITIYDTMIDYPMVKPTKDNDEYMSRNPKREFDAPGSIFLDVKNASDFSDFNTIIFGHHMSERKMFGDIDLFLEQSFFNSHQYGNLFFNGQNHGLEIVAICEVAAGDATVYAPGVKEEAQRQAYITYLQDRAKYWRDGTNVATNDHIVILSTCSADITNGRFVLVGKLLDHEVANPFPEVVKTTDARIDFVNRLQVYLGRPVWQWALFLLLIILLMYLLYRLSRANDKRRYEKKQKEKEAE